MIDCLNDLTADEATKMAISGQMTANDVQPQTPGFELQVIARCFDALLDKNEHRLTLSESIIKIIRRHFVQGIQPESMDIVAKDVLAVIIPHLKYSELDEKTCVMACVQLSAALLSLMKQHENLENHLQATQDLQSIWGDLSDYANGLVALEPTQSLECQQIRQNLAGFGPDAPKSMEKAALNDWIIFGFDDSPDGFEGFSDGQPLSSDICSNPQAISRYVKTLFKSPLHWIWQQYQIMQPLARHAVFLIISSQRQHLGLSDIPENCFETWLQDSARQSNALKNWIMNAPLCGAKSPFEACLLAIRSHEQGQTDWYSAWMRQVDFEFPPCQPDLGSDLKGKWSEYESFWRSMAWNDAGQPKKAIEILQSLALSGQSRRQHWLMLSWLCAQNHAFGESEHALTMARESVPQTNGGWFTLHKTITMSETYWENAITQVGHELAKLALQDARKSPQIDESLLELALKYGDGDTIAEAGLCLFDGKCPNLLPLIQALEHSPNGRTRFIEKLADRLDTSRVEDLFYLYDALSERLGITGEMKLFLALCQWNEPYMASQSLEDAIASLDEAVPLYWCAVELWIALKCSQTDYPGAIYGVMSALGSSHTRSTRALLLLIASIPKDAYGMLQSMMLDSLGPEVTRQAFLRARQGIPPEIQHSHDEISWPEIAISLLPIGIQLQFRASRQKIEITPEIQEKQLRRETVLRARGMGSSHPYEAPEPAQWVHQSQPRASDAFD